MSLVWMQNHTLISLVRAERALWDSAYSGYRDADARNEAWERVISGLGLSSLSQSQMIMIIRRWRNLRDTFARKHKCAMKKGDAAAVRASSRWKHYNSLMFLQDVLEPRRRTRRTKATEQDMKSASSIKQEHEDPGESSASQLLATVSGNVATSPSDTDTPVTHYTIQTMPASPSSSSSSAGSAHGRFSTRRTKATEQDMKSASSIKQEHEDPGESSASQLLLASSIKQEHEDPGESSASQLLLATVSGNVATSPSDTDTPVTHYTIQTMPASPSSSSSSAGSAHGSPRPDNDPLSVREARSPSPAFVLPTSEPASVDLPQSHPFSRNAITFRTGAKRKRSDADACVKRSGKPPAARTTQTEHFLLSLADHLDQVPDDLRIQCKIHLLDVLTQYRERKIPTRLLPLPPLSNTEK
ncbi:uncharacterized protein LOC144106267 [Amblyomma americanum]